VWSRAGRALAKTASASRLKVVECSIFEVGMMVAIGKFDEL
jgi:hypothetical protein